MEIIIPQSLKSEHEVLRNMLNYICHMPGKTGKTAKSIAAFIHSHFNKEEEYALPSLGLLPMLAESNVSIEMLPVIEMTDELKLHLPEMLSEHEKIDKLLKNLIKASESEKHPEASIFARELMLHAKTEEEVIYPAAILIGEHLKLMLGLNIKTENLLEIIA